MNCFFEIELVLCDLYLVLFISSLGDRLVERWEMMAIAGIIPKWLAKIKFGNNALRALKVFRKRRMGT